MRKKNRWKAIGLSLLMFVFYCMPALSVQANQGATVNAKIEKATATIVSQTESKLQPGDSFGVKVRVYVSGYVPESNGGKPLYFTDAIVSGAVTSESKPYLKTLTSEKVCWDGVYEFEISGLIYSGNGNEVSACIKIDDNNGGRDNAYMAQSDSFTLVAYKGSDFADTLSVEKQENRILHLITLPILL